MAENRNGNTAVLGALMLVAGGIIGAGVALLFAPKTGKETREDLGRYATKTRRRAEEVVDDLSSSISEMVDKVGEKASELLDSGKDAAGTARESLLKAIDEGQEKLEKQRSRLAKLFSKE
ncbi:YtxH domain-containing protein [Geobacter sp. DSM 9736]|uniref:YtxH domain-containing protein n=1 Tax=Geobacter sp. DSM 9736 TaxID=1277350 RepID=UPI000B50669D|nr:YtxH domain-containing protein [Geobacter sp. DSM 9736]SNB44953.1 Gas vesicle protein [Geobacter sp. DSM 9736]